MLSVKAMRWTAVASTAILAGIWGCGGGGGGGGTAQVASITVTPGQSIGVNQTKYLTAVARDADGNTISTSPGDFDWRVVTGTNLIRFGSDGRAVGLAEGVPTVAASIGSVKSPAAAVTVNAAQGGCTSSTYAPNYVDEILTPNIPNVSGNLRFWSRAPLRIRFVRESGWTQNLENIFKLGLDQWQAATSNGIAFSFTESSSNADITVRFIPVDELPNSAIGVTYATYNAETFEMSSARIDIGSDLGSDTVSLTTSAHEIGHALGIGGHSPNDNDLMFYAENGTTTTSTQDLNTLRTIYCNLFPRPAADSLTRGALVTERIFCPRPDHKH
ncbi:MAG: matrixin family metalloprotease [Fimbriimonas sp.]